MSDLVKSLLREFAQKLVGMVALWLVAHGLPVPQAVTDWTVLALVAAGLFLWTGLVRFFETRYGDTWVARALRRLAQFLMLGIKTKPVYVKPAPTAPAGVTGTYVGGK